MFPVFQIVQVGLMMVGLLLKTDMEIGFLPVPVLEKQEEPLYAVPKEEWDIQKFLLLGSMNQFMVQFRSA